jgi:hypothetical protein
MAVLAGSGAVYFTGLFLCGFRLGDFKRSRAADAS